MNEIEEYLKSVRAELEFVKWPTKKMTIVFTSLVIVLSAASAVYLGALDYLLKMLVTAIVA